MKTSEDTSSDFKVVKRNVLAFNLEGAELDKANDYYDALNFSTQKHKSITQVVWRGNYEWMRIVPLTAGGSVNWALAAPWFGPVSIAGLPGSGEMQDNAAYVLPNKKLVQDMWRGNQGWSRVVPIKSDGSVDWNQAGSWTGPLALTTLPGSGDMQGYAAYVLPNKLLVQNIWRGNQGWSRTASLNANGNVNWAAAGAWEGPFDINRLPGSDDMQGYTVYTLPNQTLGQDMWRGNQGWVRSVPLASDGNVNWAAAGAWTGPFDINKLPGRGPMQSYAAYELLGGATYPKTHVGNWEDITYTRPGENRVEEYTEHFRRLRYMAQAGRKHDDDRLMQATEKALKFISAYVNPQSTWDPKHGASARWEISIAAFLLGPSLVYVQGKIDSALYQLMLDTQKHLVDNFSRKGGKGANEMWRARGYLFYALAADDLSYLEYARSLILPTLGHFAIGSDGIRSDNSYHDHTNQLMIGGYGAPFAAELGLYALWTENTTYALPADKFNYALEYVQKGTRWAIRSKFFDLSAIGRSNYNPEYHQSVHGLSALLLFAQFASPYQNDFIASAKSMLTNWGPLFNKEYAPLATAVLNSPVAPAEPTGHRHYPESDYTVHRKPEYFISVRNLSKRTQGSEDLQGFHRADGYTYISLTGNEYWGDDVQPAMNWYYAPGTTVEFQTPPLKSDHRGGIYQTFPTRFGKPNFVGGAHTESEGASGADFAPNYSCLTGKKSWFFFDEEMVALGSNLTCDSDNPVRTTITQWPLSNLLAPLVVNNISQPFDLDWSQALGRIHWAHLENIGYFFPTPQFIHGDRRNQSGNWGDLAVGLDPTTRAHPFVTLWFEHGTNISDATYQYAIVPNIAQDQMLAYASANPLRVLANDSAIHAVKKPKINAVGAVFWQPGAIDKVTVNKACIVYYRQRGNVVEIAVAKPTHNAAKLRLTYNEKLYPLTIPSEVKVTSDATTTTLSINVSRGKNYLSTFSTVPT